MTLPSFLAASLMLAADLQRLDDVAAERNLDADILGVAAVCPLPKWHVDAAHNERRLALLYIL